VRRTADVAPDPSRIEHGIPGDAFFLVWGPPSHGPRSQVFARALGIEIRNVMSSRRRGALVAPFKYASMLGKTSWLLLTLRPPVVFVQSPPTFAAMTVCAYAAITGARFVVDAHSAAMSPIWMRPIWLSRLVARRAAATIVTNEHFARRFRVWGATALVIPDIPTDFRTARPSPLAATFNVMVVCSFAPDEPLTEIVRSARELPGVDFHVTGDPKRDPERLPDDLPTNVHLTGFLPDPQYYALMASCQAVLSLTTRDHTMQRGACEALWVGTPIVTSNWPVLREYFTAGTVHVGGTAGEIRDGISEMVRDHPTYRDGIEHLREDRRKAWQDAIASIAQLLQPRGIRRTTSTRRRRA
jgi:glycosyltransferase involved in cell wall biosynthesis